MIFPNHYLKLAPISMQMTCIFYQHEGVKKIENFVNKEFLSLCQWFIDNKLLICFETDKTKSILFSKARGLRGIKISLSGDSIKQHETVEYFCFPAWL